MREKKSPNSYKNRKKKVNRGNKKGKETELCMMSAKLSINFNSQLSIAFGKVFV